MPGRRIDEQTLYIVPKIHFEIAKSIRMAFTVGQFFSNDSRNTLASVSTAFGKADKHISVGYLRTIVKQSPEEGNQINADVNIFSLLRINI